MSLPSSSLPPSFSSFPDIEAGSSKRITDSSNNDKKRRKTSHSSEHRSEANRRHKLSEKDLRVRRNPDEESQNTNPVFYFDRKGDSRNIQYGGLHAGDIPKYRLVAGGRNVLGLSKALVIVKRVGKGVEIGVRNEYKAPGLTSSASRTLLARPPSRRMVSAPGNDQHSEIDGVIRFPAPQRTERHSEERHRLAFTSTLEDGSDSSLSSGNDAEISSDESIDQPFLTAHQETLKRLEQELEARPGDADTWNSLLDESLSEIPILSKNAARVRSEITLSILARAFSASSQNATNKTLMIRYLQAGEQVWHENKLRSEWENALNIGDIEIQIEWLEWRIRKGSDGVDQIIEDAVRIYEGLKPDENSELAKVRIFWRVAIALRSAGYSERAFAMFQAQAELIYNLPRNLAGTDFQRHLNELNEFWESECPRFGEDGAIGWASWHSSQGHVPSSATRSPQSRIIKDLDPYRQWASQELETDIAMYLPLKSDSDSQDPYATVLFTDIRSMMINLTCQLAKNAFRLAWLSFLGLYVPGISLATNRKLDWDDRWNLGHLIRPSYLDGIFPSNGTQTNVMSDAVAGVLVGRERAHSSPFGPVRCWGQNVSLPLDYSSAEPGKILRHALWTKRDIANIDEALLRRLFKALKNDADDPEWDTLALTFELAANPKNAVKQSKYLLSINQGSLILWNAHALLERRRDRMDSARKLYETVLISTKPARTQRGIGQLYLNWVEMEWLAGNDQQALDVILRSADLSDSTSGVVILRAKRAIEDAAEFSRTSNGWKEQEYWVKLRAMLELLTGNDPPAAFGVFDKYLALESDICAKESLMTASLIMIYCHWAVLKRPMAPSILRERAQAAFAHYPSNSIILGIVLETEKGQGVWGRIRSMLGGNDGKVKDVARRVEEVWIASWEKGRWLGEVERTRNGLAAAVEHERTRSSFIIWRIYIEFEIRVGDLKRAKKLLFRAISECPLVKELYLLAFGPLRGVFRNHELQGLADTMVERGIRLRQGLDEVVEGYINPNYEARESDDEREDEIEHNANELRRLMPY